ncbi:MAG: hypothetical protein D4R63_06095 [Methylococcaceae bacterium]|nr:MAG: hypothetical protein D4R63_06095 [Methylococcaceae bacterium]
MKKSIFLLLVLASTEVRATGFVVNGIGISQNITKVRENSTLMTTPGDEHNILEYCNEQDKEKKEFFSFKSRFFDGFESRVYVSEKYPDSKFTKEKTIEGFKIEMIKYDIYKDKIASIDISLDTYSAGSFGTTRILNEFFRKKFGKPFENNKWKIGAEYLSFEYDIIGTTHIHIVDKSIYSKIDNFTQKACSTVSTQAINEYKKIIENQEIEKKKEAERELEHMRSVERSWEPEHVEQTIKNGCAIGMFDCR